MGRIFEVRKHSMFARYDRMAKQFTRIGKEIAIAVKAGGPDPDSNPALRRVMQNAKGVNMPKDKVEAAIKRAMGRDMSDYEEVLYEGYAPHGVAVLIETATDNITRTVANVRAIFNKYNGSLSTAGSVSFQFKRMGVFKLAPAGLNVEELELELIDFGLEEMGEGTGEEGEEILVISLTDGRKIAFPAAAPGRLTDLHVSLLQAYGVQGVFGPGGAIFGDDGVAPIDGVVL